MRLSRALQLLTLLVGFCLPGGLTSQKLGEVPVSQLKMLALGLGYMLQGVEENVQRLEQQAQLVRAEVDSATKGMESLRKRSVQTGRVHRQMRRDLQIRSARRDRLQKAVSDMQKDLEGLEREQGAMQQQMNRIIQSVKKSLSEPRSRGRTQPHASLIKVFIDKQARRLASLTSEVLMRERLINRHLRLIKHLEEQLS